MNNGIDTSSHPAQPERAIRTHPLPETHHGDDTFVASRPAWLSPSRWRDITEDLDRRLDELSIAAASSQRSDEATQRPRTCADRAWCTMSDPAEHSEYHAGDAVDLAGSDGTGTAGWWAWLTEERRSHCDPQVMFEGIPAPGDEVHVVTMSAGDVADVLAATATPEARAALEELVSAALAG